MSTFNVAPVTTADIKTVDEDSGATLIDVLDNDSDVDATDSLTITQVRSSNGSGTTENNGTVSISDGKVSYTPADNFNGSDSFQYLASDGTTDGGLTTVTVTVNPVNDDPTGAVTISGTAKTGQTLTADNTLADVDGLGAISYQWAKDGVDVSGATNSTLVLSDTDIGSTYTVTASYTDGDGTVESVPSSATAAVTDIDKLFLVSSEIIKASAAPDGAYALDPNEDIIKLTINLDIARTTDDSVDSVLGGVLDFDLDWTKIEVIQYNDSSSAPYVKEAGTLEDLDGSGAFALFYELSDSNSTANQFDTVTITSLYVDTAKPPTLTLVDNVDTTAKGQVDHASSNDVGYIYLNPVDTVTSLDVTFGGAVQINQGNDPDITQLSYTVTVDIV